MAEEVLPREFMESLRRLAKSLVDYVLVMNRVSRDIHRIIGEHGVSVALNALAIVMQRVMDEELERVPEHLREHVRETLRNALNQSLEDAIKRLKGEG